MVGNDAGDMFRTIGRYLKRVKIQPHQQRVVDEKAELDERRSKLLAFFNTDLFRRLDQAEKDRLRTQHSVMGVYSEVLGQRITAFTQV